MRPVRLTMHAFGSYASETTIDFTKPNQNLFLITGDTGSGKSTIFDAMVFALYGEASSSITKKDGQELQSQFADRGAKPWVELEFTEERGMQPQTYLVRRSPRYLRPKQRGTGFIDEKESVALYFEDGSEYGEKIKETNEKIEEIIGLTKDQFMQVAMIAQGEFRELLRAGTNEKKAIFRKLFHTEPYQRIVDELWTRVKAKKGEMEEIHTRLKTLSSQIELPSEEAYMEAAQALRRMERDKDLNITDIEILMQNLKDLDAKQLQQEDALQEETALEEAKRTEKQNQLATAKELLKQFSAYEQAQEKLAQLTAKQAEIDQLQILARQIADAYEVKTSYDRANDLNKQVNQMQRELKRIEQNLPKLTEAVEEAKKAEQDAVKKRDEASERLAQLSAQAKEAKARQQQREELSEQLRTQNRTYIQAQDRLQQIQEQLITGKKTKELLDTALEANKRAVSDYELWEQAQDKVLALKKSYDLLENGHQDLSSYEARHVSAMQEYRDLMKGLEEKEELYQHLFTLYYNDQAGILARDLQEGSPCPVCGSPVHPHPAHLSEDVMLPTKEELEEKKQETEKLRNNVAAKAADLSAMKQTILERKNLLNQQTKELSEALGMTETDLGVLKDAVLLKIQQEKETGEKLRQAREIYQKNEAKRSNVIVQIANLEKTLERERTLEQEQLLRKNALETQLHALQEQAASDTKLIEELKPAEAEKKRCDNRYQKASDQLLEQQKQKTTAEGRLQNIEGQLPQLEADLDLRVQEFHNIRDKKGISDTQQMTEIIGAYSKEDMQQIRNQVDAHMQVKREQETILATAGNAIDQREKPDEIRLQADVEAANQLCIQKQQALHNLTMMRMQNEKIRLQMDTVLQSRGKQAAEYSRVQGLYDRLAGKVSGSRMDLETYVQRYHLRRILVYANMRFVPMSGGQFELRMTDEDQAGSGKNRGLDLMVYSTVTGQESEVKTLSGGESFMAALSLALGIADQIQASSSALHLDMMFIDEGFGSLDDSKRSNAVHILQEMAGGDKLIGIISHVSELRAALDNQLVITKDQDGSHVKWQIS